MKLTLYSLLLFATIYAQPSNTVSQTVLTGGGCSEIPGIGTPILMVNDTNKFIEDALDLKNKYTQVKYIYFNSTTNSSNPGLTSIRLIFELLSFSGSKYIAIDLESMSYGIGNTKIIKFMMSNDLSKIGLVFNMPDIKTATASSYSCGDLKFAFTNYGKSNSNKLDYIFPGFNQNGGSASVLDVLNSKGDSSTTKKTKTCVTKNYKMTSGFYGSATTAAPQDFYNCIPDKPSVASITINCNTATGRIRNLMMTYNNFKNDGVNYSPNIGDSSSPVSATTEIDLRNADKIQLISYFLPGVNKSITINTLDQYNQVLKTYTCGSYTGGTRSDIIIEATNFLGFNNVQLNTAGTVVERVEIVSYYEN